MLAAAAEEADLLAGRLDATGVMLELGTARLRQLKPADITVDQARRLVVDAVRLDMALTGHSGRYLPMADVVALLQFTLELVAREVTDATALERISAGIETRAAGVLSAAARIEAAN